jgi:hypothetical protein
LLVAPASVPLQLAKAEALVGAGKYSEALLLARYMLRHTLLPPRASWRAC